MIEVTNVSLRLGKARVLDDVSARFAQGRVTAILGPNGAGKTSLLRAMAGLVAVESGGVSLARLSLQERARTIGYLPQNGQPAWAITVRELVELGRLPHRSRFAALSPVDEAAIEAALASTDMAALADRPVDALSGGEKARAKFARVLAGDPDWILADEPLANLDPPHARDVERLLRDAADGGKGVVVVLHQLNAALRLADDVVLIKAGRVLAAGPVRAVLEPDTLEALFGMRFRLVEDESGRALVPLS
ncbi:MAG: ABC transporter ATP-binding protein [Sphingomonadales bacterium]|nr:ABC transporter ATP-binding protein [Sphingomonadales bacterium]